ncbi:unnamed protein product [Parnassius apollo]|uniref:(apollo) hypothetical protein n=1 Tax=Parnassius apollo TaxID=110799 RepID=A0A8S3XFP1_PARAO|nr:unnamed protein product [Parnassius apollo]
MAYFKAIGKYIESSGLMEILVEALALAGGSTNSFLDSKHFNRCKRLHPLLSGALQVLHFEEYLSQAKRSSETLDEDSDAENGNNFSDSENIFETLNEDLESVMNNSCEVNERLALPDSLQNLLKNYKEFREETLRGGHGRTAQYYLQYTELVNLYLRFSRSIRCSNFELYLDSISKMCDYFFAFNLPNYSKWAAMYLNNLIKLD